MFMNDDDDDVDIAIIFAVSGKYEAVVSSQQMMILVE